MPSDRPLPETQVCRHGSLARSCETCAVEAERDELKAAKPETQEVRRWTLYGGNDPATVTVLDGPALIGGETLPVVEASHLEAVEAERDWHDAEEGRYQDERNDAEERADEIEAQRDQYLGGLRELLKHFRDGAEKHERDRARCKRDEARDRASGKLKDADSYIATWNYYEGVARGYEWAAKRVEKALEQAASEDSTPSQAEEPCKRCDGRGYLGGPTCRSCDGTGKTPSQGSVSDRAEPEGVDEAAMWKARYEGANEAYRKLKAENERLVEAADCNCEAWFDPDWLGCPTHGRHGPGYNQPRVSSAAVEAAAKAQCGRDDGVAPDRYDDCWERVSQPAREEYLADARAIFEAAFAADKETREPEGDRRKFDDVLHRLASTVGRARVLLKDTEDLGGEAAVELVGTAEAVGDLRELIAALPSEPSKDTPSRVSGLTVDQIHFRFASSEVRKAAALAYQEAGATPWFQAIDAALIAAVTAAFKQTEDTYTEEER